MDKKIEDEVDMGGWEVTPPLLPPPLPNIIPKMSSPLLPVPLTVLAVPSDPPLTYPSLSLHK